MAQIKPKRGVVFGSRLNVESPGMYVDSKSSPTLVAASPYQTNVDSGLRDTILLASSREHGYQEFTVTGQVLGTDLNSGAAVSIIIPSSPPPANAGGSEPPPQALKIYITDIFIVTDATGLAGGTNVKLTDTAGTPIVFTTCAVTGLGANQVVIEANAAHSLGAAILTGGTVNQGLQWIGTGTFTGAGTFYYRVKGYFAP